MDSLSEANSAYRSIIETNNGKHIRKMFSDVGEQVDYYRNLGVGAASPDFGVTGSPCNPFSCQRTKRFANGDVSSHQSFQTTMSGVIDWYEVVQPKIGITEQVLGFDLPFSSSNRQTPLQMFHVETLRSVWVRIPGAPKQTFGLALSGSICLL